MHKFVRLFVGIAYFLLLSTSHAMDNGKQSISDIFVAADVAYKDYNAHLHEINTPNEKVYSFYSKIENFSISVKEEEKYYMITFTPIFVKEFSILGGGGTYKIDKHTYRIVEKVFFQ
jgi:hypothetical protein